MQQTPLISVIVPVYNRAGLVQRTLDSIAAQTMTHFHLIIVDNDSTDSTPEVLRIWASAHESDLMHITLCRETTPGASAARNRGLEEADTEYVMFFDSDDVMLPSHMERIQSYLINRPDTRILRWDIGVIDHDGWMHVKSHTGHDELCLHLLHSTLATHRFAVRTDILRQCGGWDNDLPVWNDLELGVRLLLSGCKVSKLPGTPTVTIFPTDESITGTSYSSRKKGHRLAMEKIRSMMYAPQHSPYLHILDAKQAITAGLYRREGDKDGSREVMSELRKRLSRSERIAVNLIYTAVWLFGAGGATLATMLFPVKSGRP